MKTPEHGPVYGVLLLDTLPLNGGMSQKMPSRDDLNDVRQISERTAAAFEVLTSHYRNAMAKVALLEQEAKLTNPRDSKFDRLFEMCRPEQQTWDLSPNDVQAIKSALVTLNTQQALLSKVAAFANKMSSSGAADRARAGNDVLELLAQSGFME